MLFADHKRFLFIKAYLVYTIPNTDLYEQGNDYYERGDYEAVQHRTRTCFFHTIKGRVESYCRQRAYHQKFTDALGGGYDLGRNCDNPEEKLDEKNACFAKNAFRIIPMNIAMTAAPITWIGNRLSKKQASRAISTGNAIPDKSLKSFSKSFFIRHSK